MVFGAVRREVYEGRVMGKVVGFEVIERKKKGGGAKHCSC
jgi:hypothetical protein